jgi:hypothetical protein
LTFLITSTICAWTVKASPASLVGDEVVGDEVVGDEVVGDEVVGDGVACDSDDGDGTSLGVAVAPATDADDCGLPVWKATRAPTLAEPDVPQAITTSAIRMMDIAWATTRCVVRRRDTDTWYTSWARRLADGRHRDGHTQATD